jgi:hypothetical protein
MNITQLIVLKQLLNNFQQLPQNGKAFAGTVSSQGKRLKL